MEISSKMSVICDQRRWDCQEGYKKEWGDKQNINVLGYCVFSCCDGHRGESQGVSVSTKQWEQRLKCLEFSTIQRTRQTDKLGRYSQILPVCSFFRFCSFSFSSWKSNSRLQFVQQLRQKLTSWRSHIELCHDEMPIFNDVMKPSLKTWII